MSFEEATYSRAQDKPPLPPPMAVGTLGRGALSIVLHLSTAFSSPLWKPLKRALFIRKV